MNYQMNDIDYQEALALAEQDVDFDEMEQDIEQFAQDPSVREVLAVGVDLQNYGSEIARQLKTVESESINDYLRQVPLTAQLHGEIAQCDEALAEIEKSLSQFKGSLGQLSSDICTLQTKSQAITIKLTNRKNLEEYLGQYARDISLSRDFINHIVNGVVGPHYVRYLQELNHKLEMSKSSDSRRELSSSAAKEIKVPLDRLRLKATDNVRKWLIEKINSLRDHYESVQIAVQTELLKSKYLFSFIKKNSPETEQALREYYTAIMSRIYYENFRVLADKVFKRMKPISMLQEMIVPVIQKGFFSSKRYISESKDFFEIGERHRILHDILSPPQPFGEDVQYPVEALMRSLYQTLIDAITAETAFATDFFADPNIGMPIFAMTARFFDTFTTDLLSKVNDPVCMVFLLRFAVVHRKEMSERKISLLDAHFTSLQQKITARFRSLLAMNRSAIDNCEVGLFIENQANPHFANSLTKRFAEFALSMAIVNNADTDDLTRQEIQLLSQSTIKLLERICKSLNSNNNNNGGELQLVFLINNYFHIVSTLRETEGGSSSVVLPIFEQYLSDTYLNFIELLLRNTFQNLVNIVTDAFEKVDNDQPRKTNFNVAELEEIATDFKTRHTERIRAIIDAQLAKFDDPMNGKEIMMQIAKRLVIYWAKFYQLCTIVPRNGKSLQWMSSMPTVGILVNEIQSITEKL